MTTATRLDALAEALAAVDVAVGACLAVAWAGETSRADEVVDAYQQADRRADLLLAAIIGAGGCPGLLDLVERATRHAADRTAAVLALAQATDSAADRAIVVAEHAEERANARDVRVRREVVLPWAQRRVSREEAA